MIRPKPAVLLELQEEPVLLRLCCWAEARGESRRGQLAVLWVIHNRAQHRDTSLKVEVLRPLQFSAFNANDPNRGKMLDAAQVDPIGWAGIDALCEVFEQGSTLDPTEGARNYYVTKMPHPPAWGPPHAGWMHHVDIGAHSFGIASGG